MPDIKIAIHQFNPIIGDLDTNVNAIIAAVLVAKDNHCDLFITSELAICGYPPEDLLLRDEFYIASSVALQKLLQIKGITIVCGCPYRCDVDTNKQNKYQYNQNQYTQATRSFNSAFVIRDGVILNRYDKQVLPNYGIFDECRYFIPGDVPLVFNCNGVNVGIIICEDMWNNSPAIATANTGAEILCVLNASPYEIGKHEQRLSIARNHVKETNIPLIYVNQVGGQDELVFDGASFALDKNSELCLQLSAFTPEIGYIDYSVLMDSHALEDDRKSSLRGKAGQSNLITLYPERLESIYNALVLAVRDYINKNGFKGVVLGLSGGIDSALVLALAFDALGCDRVMAVMMPSQYTADISNIDAQDMITRLGVRSTTIAIEPMFDQFKQSLAPTFTEMNSAVTASSDTTFENLQARTRGVLLMAISNKLGYLVLTTGNKSEIATGYATLYGDMAGGFAPLKDVSKTLVYELSNFRNSISAIIPNRIIMRPPSAELRENQTDQDSLPDYAILDQIIELLVEDGLSAVEIVARGFAKDVVKKTAHLLKMSEYKRKQAAIGPKISTKAFGKEWRYPITNKFNF